MGRVSNEAEVDAGLRAALAETLALPPARVASFHAQTPLFGALPELDSMAVANLFGAIEDRLGIVIDDDAVDGDLVATFGSLYAFVRDQALG